MKKLVYIVCGLNASRSQVVEEFLKGKYSDASEIEIKSAGLNVDILREDDKRTPFTKELAEKASIIFVSDHDKFYRVRYNLLKNNKRHIGKIHLLRIPDVFHIHKNAHLGKDISEYIDYLNSINQQPEFSALRKYVSHLTQKEASALMEALYIKELYSAHLPPNMRQDKKYPFQLLYKTLEFRLPWISRLIENTKL